jgi:hypothetical protein
VGELSAVFVRARGRGPARGASEAYGACPQCLCCRLSERVAFCTEGQKCIVEYGVCDEV